MDVVITYVNSTAEFVKKYNEYIKKDLSPSRFRSYHVLDIQVKLIRKYMPYIKNIFIVVCDKSQVAEYEDLSGSIIIEHSQIIPQKYLPCFNSCTIEMFLHNIPGLDEQFVYFNDDMFVIDKVSPLEFFKGNQPCLYPKIKDIPESPNTFDQQCINSSNEIFKKLKKEKSYLNKYFTQEHICKPYLKKTFNILWSRCKDDIECSLTRTRHKKNFNCYLFNNYDIVSENYIKLKHNYLYIDLYDTPTTIKNQIGSTTSNFICINDNGVYCDFDKIINKVKEGLIWHLNKSKGEQYINEEEEPSIEISKIIERNNYNSKIIVSFTSWTKRIHSCKTCVENLFNQSVKPDLIYLNLSIEEFPNKEKDLPNDLIELSNNEKSFIINWVDGPNTKTMKKIFPILQYLNDEDIIINIDDDMLIPTDLIKSRLEDFNKYHRQFAISSNFRGDWCFCKIPNGEKIWTCACASLMQKKMLNNFEKILTKKIIETYTDDCVYSILAYINGYKFERCSDYARQKGTEHRIFEEDDLQDSALRNCNGYKTNTEVVEIFEKDFFRKYHIHLCNAFNYFRKKIIVSLTSYPKRTNNPEIVKCIESIINQTLSPDKIILYLTSAQYPNKLKDIPKYLLNFYKDKKIDIQFRDDIIKPHTKWYYAFQEYSNDIVITVDDDIIYPTDLIESLYKEWENNQNCIIASRCHIITYSNGRASKYKKFIQYKTLTHSYKLYNENLFLTGVGGVLYNVSLFNKDTIFNLDLIKDKYLTVDDVYLNKIIKEQNIPIICINKYDDYAIGDTVLQGLNETGLWIDNLKNVNDIAIYESKFKENKNIINICYITDDNYIPLTVFSIETLISKISNDYQYNIFILHTGNPINIKFTKKNLHIINIKVDLENILPQNIIENRNDVIKHVSTTALIKFAIPNIFQNLNKILYIDGDIVFKNDVSKIFNNDINEYYIGAVADDVEFESYELWDKCFRNMHNTSLYFKIHDKCIKENGFYFNSGVILFNLKKLRNINITNKLIEFKAKNKTTFVDQDTFNLVLGNNTKKLSKFYNYFFRYGNIENENIVSIHVAEKLDVEKKLNLMKTVI